jgi:hypothetical protein
MGIGQAPHEFALGGVFMPPLFIAAVLGTLAAALTTRMLNRRKLSLYFYYPPLVVVAFVAIYTVLIGTLIIPV